MSYEVAWCWGAYLYGNLEKAALVQVFPSLWEKHPTRARAVVTSDETVVASVGRHARIEKKAQIVAKRRFSNTRFAQDFAFVHAVVIRVVRLILIPRDQHQNIVLHLRKIGMLVLLLLFFF